MQREWRLGHLMKVHNSPTWFHNESGSKAHALNQYLHLLRKFPDDQWRLWLLRDLWLSNNICVKSKMFSLHCSKDYTTTHLKSVVQCNHKFTIWMRRCQIVRRENPEQCWEGVKASQEGLSEMDNVAHGGITRLVSSAFFSYICFYCSFSLLSPFSF